MRNFTYILSVADNKLVNTLTLVTSLYSVDKNAKVVIVCRENIKNIFTEYPVFAPDNYDISYVCYSGNLKEDILLYLKTIGNELQYNNVILIPNDFHIIFLKPFSFENCTADYGENFDKNFASIRYLTNKTIFDTAYTKVIENTRIQYDSFLETKEDKEESQYCQLLYSERKNIWNYLKELSPPKFLEPEQFISTMFFYIKDQLYDPGLLDISENTLIYDGNPISIIELDPYFGNNSDKNSFITDLLKKLAQCKINFLDRCSIHKGNKIRIYKPINNIGVFSLSEGFIYDQLKTVVDKNQQFLWRGKGTFNYITIGCLHAYIRILTFYI